MCIRDSGETELFFTDLLERLETNYIDIGMLHMVDNDKDLEAIQEGGILEYALQLKEKGVIKKLGMSSHNSETALKAVKAGLLDGLMLSEMCIRDRDYCPGQGKQFDSAGRLYEAL